MSLHSYQHVAELLLDHGDQVYHHHHSGDDDLSDEEECIHCVLTAQATYGQFNSHLHYIPATAADIAIPAYSDARKTVPAGFSLRAPPSINV